MKKYKFTSTGSVLSAGLCGAELGPSPLSQSWWPHRMYATIRLRAVSAFSWTPRSIVNHHVEIMVYEVCPESTQPFWISPEPVTWPWCNLAARQRRTYCAPMNTHSPVGLVGRQWDAVEWACALCGRRIHNDRAIRSASSRRCACTFYSSRAGIFFWQNIASTRSVRPLKPRFGSLRLWLFPKLKSPLKCRRFVNATVTQYTNSVNGVSLPTDYPHGRVTVHRCTVRSPLAANLHQGHVIGSWDIQNGWILSGQPSYMYKRRQNLKLRRTIYKNNKTMAAALRQTFTCL